MDDKIQILREKVQKRIKKKKIFKIVIPSLLIVIILLTTILNYDKIYGGVYTANINLGRLTVSQAQEKLEDQLKNSDNIITLKSGNKKLEIRFSDYGEYNPTDTAKNAYNKGRKNVFTKLATFVTPFIKRNIVVSYKLDETLLKTSLSEFQQNLENPYLDDTFEIKDDILRIYTGHGGTSMDFEATYQKILEAIEKNETTTIDAVTNIVKYKGVDIDKIYKDVYSKVQNASINEETGKVNAHKNGYDFNKEKARQMLLNAEENSTYEIELIVTKPEVTTDMLSEKIFDKVLSSYTTTYSTLDANRSSNIALAASKINGKILQNGEVFSYNQTVGNRTLSAGFKVAHVYEGNTVTEGVGGGICQVSSTLYNAVLYANLGIIERTNHSIPVSYTPKGQDATVAWGSIDFKFKNTLSYPVKIEAYASNGVCTVKILGNKSLDYNVKIVNTTSKINKFKTTYTEDTTLEPGTEKIIQQGADGYVIKTVRQLVSNGNIIKTENLPSSNYLSVDQKVTRNTSVIEATEDAPQETTENIEDEM